MKVGMISLGCPKNQVDAEVMVGLLMDAGHEITASETDAEVIVVNTCAFIKDATEESIQAILETADLKEHGHLKHLIVTGCMSQRYKAGMLKELPEVDAYLGTGEFDRVAEVLAGLARGADERKAHRVPVPKLVYSHDTPRVRFTPKHWGYLKVSDGCDNRCSYCVIPSVRGRLRSRPSASVVTEARTMARQGVKEVCIIAQDITAYGTDLKATESLTGLLTQLEGIKGLEWVRLLYTHPAHYTDELLDFIAGSGKVVKYLDIPVQHIDDEILSSMGRKVTSKQIRALIKRIRAKIPGVALRTSIIVGFPGETREKFMSLLRFVKSAEFDHLGVFTYSEEEGTPAAGFAGKVSEELAAERRDQLMKAQAKISLAKNKVRVGQVYKVLVDGPSKESEMLIAGRAYFQAPDIDGVVYITEGRVKPGMMVDVEITEAHTYDLVGQVV
ncbi:MAG: 30S ribosomal protein S12 methylthiotransferase RimO [Nitrospirae bacterium]|nr:30S ribosomal protein S12 methylthiotransferase RimO [Nitrospirota bacterium]